MAKEESSSGGGMCQNGVIRSSMFTGVRSHVQPGGVMVN